MDISWVLLVLAMLVLGLGTQAYINLSYRKWNKIPISTGLTGALAARRMLDAHGLSHIAIQMIPGKLSDHFDPRTNVVSLSESVYGTASVAATAIACHEVGHAVQHAQGYAPARIRASLVPAVSIASNIWIFVMIIGLIVGVLELFWLGIILYVAVIIFQMVTLPVELNASSRALAYVSTSTYLPPQEQGGAKRVLRAAAMTYIAAALISVLQLLYLIGMARR
ncbi:MAG: zinc metallopeptidase [Coriobacteriales bacterium]|jgi:Zn-dependent membrane protease YugP|nr:zinc metallopeptidase [Coriobacteriales bacterium]